MLLQQPASGRHSVAAIGAEAEMAAIMQQNDFAAIGRETRCDSAQDCFRRARVPVIAGDRPHDRLQLQTAGGTQNAGAAAAERWPKNSWRCTQCIFNRLAAVFE